MIEIDPHFYEVLTGWCAAAAMLLIEHVIFAPKPTPYWPRYVMGVLALLVGAWVVQGLAGYPSGALELSIIATSGAVIFALYEFRILTNRALHDAKEQGRIDGRIEEANRILARATRQPDDRRN